MIGLIILVLILIGSPPTVGADIIMTLEATSGSLRQFQDSAFGSGVSGPGFSLDGFTGQNGSALPITLSFSGEVQPGQLVDQTGQLALNAPFSFVNGQAVMIGGGLTISSIPAVATPGSGFGAPTVVVTAPFTASGILRASPLFFDQGPTVNYFFEGAGTMTSEFRASCGTANAPSCYFWNSSVLTFVAPTSPTIPEPSTWLLLASGLVVLFLSRRRLMSEPSQPHGCSR